jgi:F0F1-type ATP synthase membrane subunit b/b'
MGETLNQLAELLLSSIPAIFSLLIVWMAYRWIVYGRLQQVLGERQARTEGAVKQALEQIASAEAMVKDARAALEEDMLAAKAALQQQADGLANQIIESVLKPAVALGGR